MIWLGVIIGLLIGMALGAALYRQFMSDTVKVKALENEVETIKQEHQSYQHQVHAHFDTSATLFRNLAGNYRELYQHMADNAKELCPETVYSQLNSSKDLLKDDDADSSERLFDESGNFSPPRDYAEKTDPKQKGNLSEDYGLTKVQPDSEPRKEPAA